MPPLRRSLPAAVALMLVTSALTGCVRFDMKLTVNANETVDGTILLAAKKSLLTLGGRSAEQAFDEATADSVRNVPAETRIEPYDQDGYYGRKIIYDDVPFAEFDKAGDGGSDHPAFRHENGRVIFTMDVDFAEMNVGGRELVESMLPDLNFRVAITFPGRVIEQDHGVVSGDTVTWDLDYGDAKRLRAVAEDGTAARWGYFVLGGCCLLMVLVVVAAAIWLIRRRRPRA